MDIDLLKPFKYTEETKGKNFRSHLILLFGSIYQVPKKLIKQISDDVSCIHNTSINIDDIQDESITRRSKPCSYLVFGVPNTINASFYALFQTLEKMEKNYPISVTNIVLKEIVNLHKGQGLDIVWNETQYIPTIEEYFKMIDLKTTSLFRIVYTLCYKLGNIKEKEDLSELIYLMGNFFQIRDDYVNCCDSKYWEEKGFFEDMNQGKCTYLLIKLNTIDPLFVKKYIFRRCDEKDKKIIYNKLFEMNILNLINKELTTQLNQICNILNSYDVNFAEIFKSKLYICQIISPHELKEHLKHSD